MGLRKIPHRAKRLVTTNGWKMVTFRGASKVGQIAEVTWRVAARDWSVKVTRTGRRAKLEVAVPPFVPFKYKLQPNTGKAVRKMYERKRFVDITSIDTSQIHSLP